MNRDDPSSFGTGMYRKPRPGPVINRPTMTWEVATMRPSSTEPSPSIEELALSYVNGGNINWGTTAGVVSERRDADALDQKGEQADDGPSEEEDEDDDEDDSAAPTHRMGGLGALLAQMKGTKDEGRNEEISAKTTEPSPALTIDCATRGGGENEEPVKDDEEEVEDEDEEEEGGDSPRATTRMGGLGDLIAQLKKDTGQSQEEKVVAGGWTPREDVTTMERRDVERKSSKSFMSVGRSPYPWKSDKVGRRTAASYGRTRETRGEALSYAGGKTPLSEPPVEASSGEALNGEVNGEKEEIDMMADSGLPMAFGGGAKVAYENDKEPWDGPKGRCIPFNAETRPWAETQKDTEKNASKSAKGNEGEGMDDSTAMEKMMGFASFGGNQEEEEEETGTQWGEQSFVPTGGNRDATTINRSRGGRRGSWGREESRGGYGNKWNDRNGGSDRGGIQNKTEWNPRNDKRRWEEDKESSHVRDENAKEDCLTASMGFASFITTYNDGEVREEYGGRGRGQNGDGDRKDNERSWKRKHWGTVHKEANVHVEEPTDDAADLMEAVMGFGSFGGTGKGDDDDDDPAMASLMGFGSFGGNHDDGGTRKRPWQSCGEAEEAILEKMGEIEMAQKVYVQSSIIGRFKAPEVPRILLEWRAVAEERRQESEWRGRGRGGRGGRGRSDGRGRGRGGRGGRQWHDHQQDTFDTGMDDEWERQKRMAAEKEEEEWRRQRKGMEGSEVETGIHTPTIDDVIYVDHDENAEEEDDEGLNADSLMGFGSFGGSKRNDETTMSGGMRGRPSQSHTKTAKSHSTHSASLTPRPRTPMFEEDECVRVATSIGKQPMARKTSALPDWKISKNSTSGRDPRVLSSCGMDDDVDVLGRIVMDDPRTRMTKESKLDRLVEMRKKEKEKAREKEREERAWATPSLVKLQRTPDTARCEEYVDEVWRQTELERLKRREERRKERQKRQEEEMIMRMEKKEMEKELKKVEEDVKLKDKLHWRVASQSGHRSPTSSVDGKDEECGREWKKESEQSIEDLQKEIDKLLEDGPPDLFIDSHCHLDFIYNWLVRESKPHPLPMFMSLSELYETHFQSPIPSMLLGCIPNFIRPSLFVQRPSPPPGVLLGKEDVYRIDWLLKIIQDEKVLGCTYGCHPHFAEQADDVFFQTMEQVVADRAKSRVVAIGECGVDLSEKNTVPLEEQLRVFRRQVQLAVKSSLAIVVHCRGTRMIDPEDQVLSILKEECPVDHPIHRHCFRRGMHVAKKWLDALSGVHFGFTMSASCRSYDIRRTLREIPLENILLETDAPYFKPVNVYKYASKSNHMGAAVGVAQKIAFAKNISVLEVIEQTRKNTIRLYGLRLRTGVAK